MLNLIVEGLGSCNPPSLGSGHDINVPNGYADHELRHKIQDLVFRARVANPISTIWVVEKGGLNEVRTKRGPRTP
jgi:hypothetical protein